MSVCAVMMVKDEADVIEATIRHLLTQVDQILVTDNLSRDGTAQILYQLSVDVGTNILRVSDDREVGYWQARKTTELAERAKELGHDWVLPCDADEMWVTTDGRRIGDFLLGLAPDVPVVVAELLNYMPTAKDQAGDPDPFRRIGWRLSEAGALPKVCCRLWPGLNIHAGNHCCDYGGFPPIASSHGLRINHYPWRSEAQFVSKVTNGARAYEATDLPEGTGAHWRMWGDPDAPDLPERAAAHFRKFFYSTHPPYAPGSRDLNSMVYDPAHD